MGPASLFSCLVFTLVAVAHLLRLVFQVEVLVAGVVMPMWISVVGIVVAGALALALWQEARSTAPPQHAA